MVVEGTVLEFASLTYGHVWVSDPITLAAGPANVDHDLGVEPDFVVCIVTDNTESDVDLTVVVESGNEANGITVSNGGAATSAIGTILAFFSSRVDVTSPTTGDVYELASRSLCQVFLSDEKACANGATTFDHETGRELLFAIPICVDSATGDFDLSVAETTESRITVTQTAATTVGVQVLAFFGEPVTDPVGNSVEGTVMDIASLTLGYIFLTNQSGDVDNTSEQLDHELSRVPVMAVPIMQKTAGGGADDFDLSVTLAAESVTIVGADTDAVEARALVFFGTP